MKYKHSAMAALFSIITSVQANEMHAPQTFGKTHFIVGVSPERIVHTQPIAPKDEGACSAYFSPDDNLQKLLCDRIDQEQEAIDIAIFAFTDKSIAEAVMRAYQKGIRVRIITDPSAVHDRFSKIPFLQEQGIPIYVYNTRYTKKASNTLSNIMHNKFVIFKRSGTQRSCVWTGSFNFTKSATVSNQENIMIVERRALIKQYNDQFKRLLSRCKRLKNN